MNLNDENNGSKGLSPCDNHIAFKRSCQDCVKRNENLENFEYALTKQHLDAAEPVANWPKPEVIQRLHSLGWGEVLTNPRTGENFRGLRSSCPTIIYAGAGNITAAMCFVCETVEPHSGPPMGSAGPGAPKTPLFTPDTRAFALYTLTWLNTFYRKHANECTS